MQPRLQRSPIFVAPAFKPGEIENIGLKAHQQFIFEILIV
jgi:hypothetical protein